MYQVVTQSDLGEISYSFNHSYIELSSRQAKYNFLRTPRSLKILVLEEEIYFSKQKQRVQPVVCLNTITSNNKKNYIAVLTNIYFKYSDIVNDLI